MTEMADYYGMLRPLSASLVGLIVRDGGLAHSLSDYAWKILPIAVKLRNETLFDDCLTLCLGPYGEPEYHQIEDEILRSAVEKIYGRLAIEVSDRLQSIMGCATGSPYRELNSCVEQRTGLLKEAILQTEEQNRNFAIPEFYRNLQENAWKHMKGIFGNLLEN
jgi:hypothetical protein